MLGRSREKFKKSFKTINAEVERLRVLVADLRDLISVMRPLLLPGDQDRLKDRIELLQ